MSRRCLAVWRFRGPRSDPVLGLRWQGSRGLCTAPEPSRSRRFDRDLAKRRVRAVRSAARGA